MSPYETRPGQSYLPVTESINEFSATRVYRTQACYKRSFHQVHSETFQLWRAVYRYKPEFSPHENRQNPRGLCFRGNMTSCEDRQIR